MIKKICQNCGKEYFVANYREKTTKFCSLSCNMQDKHIRFGDKIAEVQRKRMTGNQYRKGKKPAHSFLEGHTPWNKGKAGLQTAWNKGMPAPWAKNLPQGFKSEEMKGNKHWNWRGGITEKNRLIRNSREYKNWRKSVFERDRFTCVMCGYRSKKRRDIRADHIKPFSKYPELRFDISNGRTLCLPCDLKYGWQYFREQNPRVKFNER